MVIQLLRVSSKESGQEEVGQQLAEPAGDGSLPRPQCVARGVLQPHDLLDGQTSDWAASLQLMPEAPLFDAKGLRLGLGDAQASTAEVFARLDCALFVHIASTFCCSASTAWTCVLFSTLTQPECKIAHSLNPYIALH